MYRYHVQHKHIWGYLPPFYFRPLLSSEFISPRGKIARHYSHMICADIQSSVLLSAPHRLEPTPTYFPPREPPAKERQRKKPTTTPTGSRTSRSQRPDDPIKSDEGYDRSRGRADPLLHPLPPTLLLHPCSAPSPSYPPPPLLLRHPPF